MNRENLDFLYKMFPNHDLNSLDIIIVNQTTKNVILTSDVTSVKVINSFEKGLSKSRNVALKTARKEWCLLADDDLVYLKDFEKNIKNGIDGYALSGVIIFQAQLDEKELLRNYPKHSKQQLTNLEMFDVASFEILINKKSIAKNIKFNTYFGLGSNQFNCGEEQVFMRDVHNLKLDVSFYKKTIVQHNWLNTGREYTKVGRYFTKGGIYAQIYPHSFYKWIGMQLFFDVKQGHIKLSQILEKLKEALRGKKQLKQLNNEAN